MVDLQNNWTKILLGAKDNPQKKDLLTAFFLKQFISRPEEFYVFLQQLRFTLSQEESLYPKNVLAERFLKVLNPLCERFGFYEEKRALDDLCFQITKPDQYQEIEEIMQRYNPVSNKILQEVEEKMRTLLETHGFHFEISGRAKNHYSVFRKLQKKGEKNALALKDIFGFRIILNNNKIDTCFEVLHLLHDHFQPIPDYFKDYISIPKINGYQSLHTGITNIIEGLDLPVEVQIRTREMDDFAEKGMAAHWIYAQEKQSNLISEKHKELYKHIEELSQTESEEEVYFFSYDGHIYSLERGSYILDFAYSLHSSMGDRVRSALVNGVERGIHYQIQDGDQVELLLSAISQVKPDWEHYSHTKHAKRCIQRALRS